MRKVLPIFYSAMFGILAMSFFSPLGQNKVLSSSGAPIGSSGAPREGGSTCTGCHMGANQTSAGLISTNIPTEGYTPGATYQISVSAARAGINRWGFQLSPQNASGTILGSLSSTDNRTQTLLNGSYVTHTSSGLASTNSVTFSFNWTAPAAGGGSVTFYTAVNAANSDGNVSGDVILTSTLTVEEAASTSVKTLEEMNTIELWPNPVGGNLFVIAKEAGIITVLNSQGKVVSVMIEQIGNGRYSIETALLASGTYQLVINSYSGISRANFTVVK